MENVSVYSIYRHSYIYLYKYKETYICDQKYACTHTQTQTHIHMKIGFKKYKRRQEETII